MQNHILTGWFICDCKISDGECKKNNKKSAKFYKIKFADVEIVPIFAPAE